MVKIRNIKHTGANTGYFAHVMGHLYRGHTDLIIRTDTLNRYTENMDYDILFYQTFPDDNISGKFNPALVEKTDKLFNKFQGLKILVDAHDNGEIDAFSRFNDPSIPRVKCFPSKWFMDHYNIVLLSTISARSYEVFPDKYPRDIKISCKFGHTGIDFYNHRIREEVIRQLKEFFPDQVDFNRVDGREAYIEDLKHTLISVGAPGWGQYSATHQCSLRTGALLFCHRSFNDIQYLPHIDLSDAFDYVSYDLYNLPIKLQRLLEDPDRIEKIRKNGRYAFKTGYNPKKSANQLYKYLMKELK